MSAFLAAVPAPFSVASVVRWLTAAAHWHGRAGIPRRLVEHLTMSGAAVLTALPHQLSVGGLFAEGQWQRWYWIAFYVLVLAALVRYRVWAPLALTLRHQLTVQLHDGTRHPVTAVHASDRTLDLAIVKVNAKNLVPLDLGDSDGLKNGQADANKDHVITVSELQAYVIDEVRKLTQGGQNPTARRENLEYDFPVY